MAPADNSSYNYYPTPTPSMNSSSYDPYAYGSGGYYPPNTFYAWQEVVDCGGCTTSLGVFTQLVKAGRFNYSRNDEMDFCGVVMSMELSNERQNRQGFAMISMELQKEPQSGGAYVKLRTDP